MGPLQNTLTFICYFFLDKQALLLILCVQRMLRFHQNACFSILEGKFDAETLFYVFSHV